MIYLTGDTHGDFTRFSPENFPDQENMSKRDIVIVCGDFGGVWDGSEADELLLDRLNNLSFTLCFVDGNHENFEMLNSNYDVIDFMGGKAHKIRDSIFHLMRGNIFMLEGQRFFTFGGASSHDKWWRTKDVDWWEAELPTKEEIEFAVTNLKEVDYDVDYIITHCAPTSIQALYTYRSESDVLTEFLENVSSSVAFKKWFFGHYHTEELYLSNFVPLYKKIIRII